MHSCTIIRKATSTSSTCLKNFFFRSRSSNIGCNTQDLETFAEYVRRVSQSDHGNVLSQKRWSLAVYPRSLRAYRKPRHTSIAPRCVSIQPGELKRGSDNLRCFMHLLSGSFTFVGRRKLGILALFSRIT